MFPSSSEKTVGPILTVMSTEKLAWELGGKPSPTTRIVLEPWGVAEMEGRRIVKGAVASMLLISTVTTPCLLGHGT